MTHQTRWAEGGPGGAEEGRQGHGESSQAGDPETPASWTPACLLPGHTCRVRRETAEGRGREANRRAFVQANNSCARTPWPPGTGQAGWAGRGQLLPAPPPPRHTNKPRRVPPASLSRCCPQLQEPGPVCSLRLLDGPPTRAEAKNGTTSRKLKPPKLVTTAQNSNPEHLGTDSHTHTYLTQVTHLHRIHTFRSVPSRIQGQVRGSQGRAQAPLSILC